jgi:RNA polymerase sigma-70 factor (ECF subfamily)
MSSADDVAQDVCMAVVSALRTYQPKGLSFRAFVYGIAANKVADAFRAMGRNRTEPVPSCQTPRSRRTAPNTRCWPPSAPHTCGRCWHT